MLAGAEGLVELITDTHCDLVLNALVGSAGLGPTIASLGEGIDLALANKESLVVGGELVMALAEATGAQVIPVDSEHSALYQLIGGERPGTVDRLVLTASGGPFRGRSADDLRTVSREDALAHPTWDMGGKITIDSATLMNKGLELIEAHHLFGVPYEQIDVVVHPQSIIHALVHMNDGASLAHLGYPDMRVPISYALHHPDRVDVPVRHLDLVELGQLTFEAPDLDAFPCLRLAREAAEVGGTAPCVLNAANEVAVHAFLAGELPVHRDRRGDRPHARGRAVQRRYATSPTCTRRTPRRARPRGGWRRELGPRLRRLLRADHPARVRPLRRRKGRRHACRALLALLPAAHRRKQRGETEYAIGAIPLGGYVRISGMNPSEDLPDEVRDRAYHAQPVWKRMVVIAAGPAMNLLLAFVLLFAYLALIGPRDPDEASATVDAIERGYPAGEVARAGRPGRSRLTA